VENPRQTLMTTSGWGRSELSRGMRVSEPHPLAIQFRLIGEAWKLSSDFAKLAAGFPSAAADGKPNGRLGVKLTLAVKEASVACLSLSGLFGVRRSQRLHDDSAMTREKAANWHANGQGLQEAFLD